MSFVMNNMITLSKYNHWILIC